MDVFRKLWIKIPNAILVDGSVEKSCPEVIDFLDQYGDIKRDEIIDASDSEFHYMLVEFESGASVVKIVSTYAVYIYF